MTAQLLQWRQLKVRVLDWPAFHLPFNNYIIIKDGREYTFRSIPTVAVTNYKFDAPALLATIIAWRGVRHVFSSRDVELRARHDEAMKSALCGRSIGKALSKMNRDLSGYCIQPADDERGSKVWWVIPFR
jgi:hypothetical protein